MKVMRNPRRAIAVVAITAISALGLSACGPQNGTQRPDDSTLRKGIAQLIQTFEGKYPQLKNWDDAAVKNQIDKKLPIGNSTEAGWHIAWSDAKSTELSQVYVPWALIGQMPETFPPDTSHYTGGRNVPSSVIQDIRRQFLTSNKMGDYFAAITNVRYSTVDSKYIIFQTIPYLPVTDPAYGWATAATGAWKILDFGTATVGCGTVPTNVQNEFGLSCPSK